MSFEMVLGLMTRDLENPESSYLSGFSSFYRTFPPTQEFVERVFAGDSSDELPTEPLQFWERRLVAGLRLNFIYGKIYPHTFPVL